MGQNDPYSAKLTIDKKGDGGTYRVLLDGKPLENLLAADGLNIRFEDSEHLPEPQPVVTMTFGPGALDLELDVDLVNEILAHNATKAGA